MDVLGSVAWAQANVVVVVIAQQLISCGQLSRLRKSATTVGFSRELRRMALTAEQLFYRVWCDKHLICQ